MKDILFSIFPNENFVDLNLYQFGWERCAPSHSFGPAARTHYLFHYVISGTGTLNADDSSGNTRTYQIKSGQGFMIFPQQITTYIADHELPWEYVWIEFHGHPGLSRAFPGHPGNHDAGNALYRSAWGYGSFPPHGTLVPLSGCAHPLHRTCAIHRFQARKATGFLYP